VLWPWVSRRTHDIVLGNCIGYHARWVEAEARCQALEKQVQVVEALRQDEQWRRIKAEGLCAYKDERIRRVLGLPIWPAEEKKAG